MAMAWVVVGSAGQYEDHEKWIVAVFTGKDDAEKWSTAAQAYAVEFQERGRRWAEKHEQDETWPDGRPEPRSRFDEELTYDRADDVLYRVTAALLDPRGKKGGRPPKKRETR